MAFPVTQFHLVTDSRIPRECFHAFTNAVTLLHHQHQAHVPDNTHDPSSTDYTTPSLQNPQNHSTSKKALPVEKAPASSSQKPYVCVAPASQITLEAPRECCRIRERRPHGAARSRSQGSFSGGRSGASAAARFVIRCGPHNVCAECFAGLPSDGQWGLSVPRVSGSRGVEKIDDGSAGGLASARCPFGFVSKVVVGVRLN